MASLATVVSLLGCYPDDLSSGDSLRTVITVRNQNAVYGNPSRYAMIDSVVYFPDAGTAAQHANDAALKDRVRQNLNSRGFIEQSLPPTNRVDFVVALGVSTQTNVVFDPYAYWGWWPYWGYWGSGFAPGWGYYYPTAGYSYVYQSGTVYVLFVDPNPGAVSGDSLALNWVGTVNGILSTTSANVTAALNGIDQAFAQSPYLVPGSTPATTVTTGTRAARTIRSGGR